MYTQFKFVPMELGIVNFKVFTFTAKTEKIFLSVFDL